MTPFIGQIMQFGGVFAPRGWALCDGQLLSIAQNTALFSILGTTYGGDGRTTFGLPDLRGRLAMHEGTGPGLRTHRLGEKSGLETNTLNVLQMPPHNHAITGEISVQVNTKAATTNEGGENVLGSGSDVYNNRPGTGNLGGVTSNLAVGSTGNNQSINNIMPYQTIYFIIALEGTYPSRS